MSFLYALIRFFVFVSVLIGQATGIGADRMRAPTLRTPAPIRLRNALERAGGAWVKLGQMLALRYDVLPAVYCEELFALLNSVEPVDYDRIRRVIVAEFGRPPETLFAQFDPIPFASASLGQVHRATTANGTSVAVKVQRPGVRRAIRGDIAFMRLLAPIIDFSPLPVSGLREVVREFARWTNHELDYRVEARYARQLRRLAADDPTQLIPAVYDTLSSARVITTELLTGHNLVTLAGERDLMTLDDRMLLARRFLWSMLNAIYADGFFHADPHPANVVALPDLRVGYLDFGIVGQLDDRALRTVAAFGESLLTGDYVRAANEFASWLSPVDEAHTAVLEFVDILELYGRPDGNILDEPSHLSVELRLMNAARKRGLSIDARLVLYTKAVLTARGTVAALVPGLDLRPYERAFFVRKRLLDLEQSLQPGRLLQSSFVLADRIDRSLKVLQDLGSASTRIEREAARVSRQLRALALPALLGVVASLIFLRTNPGLIRHDRIVVIIFLLVVGTLAGVSMARAGKLLKFAEQQRQDEN